MLSPCWWHSRVHPIFVSSAQSLVGEEFGLTSNVSCGISLGSIICWPCRAIARSEYSSLIDHLMQTCMSTLTFSWSMINAWAAAPRVREYGAVTVQSDRSAAYQQDMTDRPCLTAIGYFLTSICFQVYMYHFVWSGMQLLILQAKTWQGQPQWLPFIGRDHIIVAVLV